MQPVLTLLAVELGAAEVDQDEVDVGAAGQHRDPGRCHIRTQQTVGEDAGTGERPALPLREVLAGGHLEGDRLRGDHVLQRAALLTGEHGAVDLLRKVGGGQDHAATRAAQRLVRGRRDDVRMRDRVGVQTRGDQAGEVGHVDHEEGTHLVGDLPEGGEVELARVGGPAGDDELGAVLVGEPADLVHVDAVVRARHLVGRDPVELPREVDAHAVGQVAAVGEVQPQDGVAGLDERHHGGRVGLGPRVRLHVGSLGTEQVLHPVDGELLDHVDVLAAAVVAPPGVALGVLVGEDGPLGLHHGERGEVLARDHLERAPLSGQLRVQRGSDLGVQLRERGVKHRGGGCQQFSHGHGPSNASCGDSRVQRRSVSVNTSRQMRGGP